MNKNIDELLERMRGAEIRVPKNLEPMVFEAVEQDHERRIEGFISLSLKGLRPVLAVTVAATALVVVFISSAFMRIELKSLQANAGQTRILHPGNQVVLPPGSEMVLRIGKDVTVVLKGAEEFRIDQAFKFPGVDRIRVWVGKGEQVWIATHNGKRRDLIISSPDALVRSLGTEFSLQVNDQGTSVELYKSNIAVRRNLGPNIRIGYGQVPQNKDRIKILKGMLDTEAMLKENEKVSISRDANVELKSLLMKIGKDDKSLDNTMLKMIEEKLPIQRSMIVSAPQNMKYAGWQRDLSSPVWAGWTVYGDDFCFGTEKGDVFRLSQSGDVKWKIHNGKAFYNEGLLFNGRFYLVDSEGVLFAIDPADGHTVWKLKTGQMMYSSPVAFAGNIFLATASGDLFLVSPTDGKTISTPRMSAGIFTKPVVSGQLIFVASADGSVACLRGSDLTQVWQARIKGRVAVSSPVFKDGILYLVNNTGEITALSGSDGSCLWVKETGSKILSTPLLAADRIYVAMADGRIMSLDKKGNMIWNKAMGEPIEAPLNGSDGLILVSTMKGHVYLLSTVDGKIKWSWSLDGQIIGKSVIAGGKFFVGTLSGKAFSRLID